MKARRKQENVKGTAAELAASNPILDLGFYGYETDTTVFKEGDGTTPWNGLPNKELSKQFTQAEKDKLASITGTNSGNETAASISGILGGVGAATITDNDNIAFLDAENANALKLSTWSAFKALLKTYFDTLYLTTVKTLNGVSLVGAGNIKTDRFTFAEYNALTTAQKQFQGTVVDTVVNLTTPEALATVFAAGWMITYSNGAENETVKLADGVNTLSVLTYGLLDNLTDKFKPGQVKESGGYLELQPDSPFMVLFRSLGFDIKGETALAPIHTGGGTVLATNFLRGTLHRPKKAFTGLTSLGFNLRVKGLTMASTGWNGLRIYEYNRTTGIGTKISESANDIAIFGNDPGLVFVNMSPFDLDPEKLYYLCLKFSGTAGTAPSVGANGSSWTLGELNTWKMDISTNSGTFPEPMNTINITTGASDVSVTTYQYGFFY